MTPRRPRGLTPTPASEPEPVAESPAAPLSAPQALAPDPPPPPSDPQPFEGVAEARLTCEICHLPIEKGDRYVKGAERGPSHPEPCSHRVN